MARYRFWLYKKDRKFRPIDKAILKIAEETDPDLAPYGQKEVDCESTSNRNLPSAVEAASQATQNSTIENPPGYLTSIYKRIADKFLARKKRLAPADNSFLELLANTEGPESFGCDARSPPCREDPQGYGSRYATDLPMEIAGILHAGNCKRVEDHTGLPFRSVRARAKESCQ